MIYFVFVAACGLLQHLFTQGAAAVDNFSLQKVVQNVFSPAPLVKNALPERPQAFRKCKNPIYFRYFWPEHTRRPF